MATRFIIHRERRKSFLHINYNLQLYSYKTNDDNFCIRNFAQLRLYTVAFSRPPHRFSFAHRTYLLSVGSSTLSRDRCISHLNLLSATHFAIPSELSKFMDFYLARHRRRFPASVPCIRYTRRGKFEISVDVRPYILDDFAIYKTSCTPRQLFHFFF